MKRVKQLVLLTAIAVLSFIALSCTPDDSVEEQLREQGCECIKHIYNDIGLVIEVQTDYISEDCEDVGTYPFNIITEDGVNYTVSCD